MKQFLLHVVPIFLDIYIYRYIYITSSVVGYLQENETVPFTCCPDFLGSNFASMTLPGLFPEKKRKRNQ